MSSGALGDTMEVDTAEATQPVVEPDASTASVPQGSAAEEAAADPASVTTAEAEASVSSEEPASDSVSAPPAETSSTKESCCDETDGGPAPSFSSDSTTGGVDTPVIPFSDDTALSSAADNKAQDKSQRVEATPDYMETDSSAVSAEAASSDVAADTAASGQTDSSSHSSQQQQSSELTDNPADQPEVMDQE
jgi:hypothetical protein